MANNTDSLRKQWEIVGAKRLDLRSYSKADIDADEETRLQNLLARMDDLASILYNIYELYKKNPDMYGERMFAFVGNSIVREWPYKDPIFTSEAAFDIINNHGCYEQFVSLPGDVARKSFNAASSSLRFEHWTPITFFRDIFSFDMNLSVEDFAQALKQNYRTVWVTKEEDNRINNKTRSFRSVSDYEKQGIKIKEKKRWELLMKLTNQNT